jgi:anti-sigma regulatory factor (Ser/Thr protein kinase)
MNCQSVALGWFSYAQHPRPEEASALQKTATMGGEEIVLPEVISVSVPRNMSLTGDEHPGGLVLARGFDRGVYSDDAETAWLAGSVAGAAGLNEVQRFHRRCEAIKRQEGLKRAQFWLVAEEKFNQAAMSFAESQGLFTSSLEQLRMLAQEILTPEDVVPEPGDPKEPDSFEITIPMSADSELVAVRAFEQIVEGIGFSEKAKGQVRMALMEACINIREAFASDTGKIHLGFKTAEDHLSVRLRPEGAVGAETDLVKAWGMKMLKTLMDEVKLHRTTQGFELVMVKRSPAAENAKSEAV